MIKSPSCVKPTGLRTAAPGPAGRKRRRRCAASPSARRWSARHEDRHRYGRAVSRCQVGGADVGKALGQDGPALAYRRYSTRYVGDEADARRREAGMWAGAFEEPWDWRGRKRG